MALYSLNAFKVAREEGRTSAEAARFSRHVATEMAEDGDLAPSMTPEERAAVTAEDAAGTLAECGAEFVTTNEETVGYSREKPHPDVHDYGGAYGYSVGNKYERGLDVAEIAKRVRADIKAAVKAKALPAGKYSVTISRFSGGRSMDVRVRDLPASFVLLNPERVKREAANPHEFIYDGHCPRYTPEGKAMLSLLERIANAYNYNRSDTMTDYFDVNYYCHVSVDWELEKRLRAAMLEAG